MKNRLDWPLLVLNFGNEKGLTPAQLQKTVFLLQKAFPKAKKLNYNFEPYHYGPFDQDVYQDAQMLADQNFVEIKQKDGRNWNTYHISAEGRKAAKKILKELDPKMVNYLEKLVSWAQSISFPQLIGSIYKKYPEYRVNSIFRG